MVVAAVEERVMGTSFEMSASPNHIVRRDGQALIEMAICMIAVLLVLGFLFQVGLTGHEHSRTMMEATEEATAASIRDSYTVDLLGSPEYIHEVVTGDDGARYSADDDYTGESSALLYGNIVSQADPERLQQFAGPNRLSTLYGAGNTVGEFDMVRGYDATDVRVLPVVRGIMYDGDSIEVESEVYMPWLKGMY